MSDLTDKQARLTSLRKARDSGVLSVRHGESATTFRTMAEIESIIAALEREIAGLEGNNARSPRYIYQSGKGL